MFLLGVTRTEGRHGGGNRKGRRLHTQGPRDNRDKDERMRTHLLHFFGVRNRPWVVTNLLTKSSSGHLIPWRRGR